MTGWSSTSVEYKWTRRLGRVSFDDKMPKRKDHLKKTFRKIKLLSVATPWARKQFIAHGNRELIDYVSECCANILKGNIPLNDQQKAKFCKNKNNLRKLALKKVNLKKTKQIIQTGEFPIGAILAPVALVLASLLFLPLTWKMQRKFFWQIRALT